jgi:protein tyrosine/serine phosphatase
MDKLEKERTKSALRKGLGILLCAAALAGCAGLHRKPPSTLDDFPLRRFDRVDAQLYRSGQPSREQLRELSARYGIRTVLKLNAGSDDAPPEVKVLHFPLNVLLAPQQAELEAILTAIEKSPKPLLVHCTHGEDRTGLIVALYRLRRGTAETVAYADMLQHGFHPYYGVKNAWQRRAEWLH